MICPECKRLDLKSRVHAHGGGITTAMCGESFYDERGRYHRHAPNRTTEAYSCSQGHSWSRVSYPKCPSCDFGGETTIIMYEPRPAA